MKKKILIFSLAYYPKHVGGAEVALKEITDRTPEIEFHMVTNRYDSTLPKVEKIGNVLVHRIGLVTKNPSMGDLRTFPLHLNKILFQLLAVWEAKKLHKKYGYDGIWAMMAHTTGVPAGIFKLRYPKVPYLLTLQEGDSTEYIEKKMRPFGLLFPRAFTSADKVQAISTFLARWAEKMGYAGDVEVVPNAVDTAHFSREYTAEEIDAIKEKLGKQDGDVFLITTSRLVKKNAVDEVIKSLALLPHNFKFVILGTGPDEDVLRALVHELKLEDRVLFLGHVDHSEMPKYLKAADIFIRPSRSEGMGNSFVEAMAARLPVIATQEGGIADFLFDAKRNPDKETTGWAVDVDSPEQIAEVAMDIVSDAEKKEKVLDTAYALVTEKYDWNIIAKDMKERVFKPLVGGIIEE